MWFRVVFYMGVAALIALVAGAGCGGCDDGGFPIDARAIDAQPSRGTVSLAWSLTDPNGLPISCEDVGANFVSVELRSLSSLSGAVASFACGNSPSTSSPIDVGMYEARFELHGQALTAVTAPSQAGVVIKKDENTQLSPVTFAVDNTGKLVLALVAPPATSNCKAASMAGAGITNMTITLVRNGGGCAPVTFIRTKGTMTGVPYSVNCSSPMVASCIENDETLTVPSMSSGSYTIHVRGKIGPADCWANDDTLQVPAQGKARTETLNLAFRAGAPGC